MGEGGQIRFTIAPPRSNDSLKAGVFRLSFSQLPIEDCHRNSHHGNQEHTYRGEDRLSAGRKPKQHWNQPDN